MRSLGVKYKSVKMACLVALFMLLQNFHGHCNSFDAPALIPMPQKIVWDKFHFKIEGNESRMLRRIVANLPEVAINQDEAYTLKVDADSLVLKA